MEQEGLNYNSKELLLISLKKYLNYYISTFLFYAFSYFSIHLIILSNIAAIILIPFATVVLYKNGKYSWIITLLLITVVPAIILTFIVEQTQTRYILLIIDLGILYLYGFSLKFAVNGWVKEIETAKLINYETEKFKEQQGYDNFTV